MVSLVCLANMDGRRFSYEENLKLIPFFFFFLSLVVILQMTAELNLHLGPAES